MEYLGLYDSNGNYTGERIERSKKKDVPEGKFFRIVIIFIQNSNQEFLIQKVSKEKGNEYATTGGHVQDGISSIETAKQEVLEELGVVLNNTDIVLFETEQRSLAFQDCYYVKKDIDSTTLKIQAEEVESVEWMTIEKINSFIQKGIFRKGNIGPFNDLINLLENEQGFKNTIYKVSNLAQKRK